MGIINDSIIPASPEQKEEKHDPIVEKVTVTNVEVPVRVLFKGKPVTNLSKDNFTLYENKQKMDINGFFLKRKKIKVPLTQETESRQYSSLPPRTFVLVFSITDLNNNLKEAVDHLFNKILKENDRVLIFANDKTVEYPNLKKKEKIREQLLSDLREESKKARERLAIYINKVETFLNIHEFRQRLHLRHDFPGDRLVDFLNKYLLTWNDYKKKYLTPRIDRFYFFSRYLEGIKGHKWVLNFYQFELFPNIRISSRTMGIIRDIAEQLMDSKEAGASSIGKLIFSLLNRIIIDLNVSKGFPTKEVSKLFYKVDATFHSFFIKGVMKMGIDEVETQEIASDIEKVLKEITDITGGQNITSNNLVKSIETVSEIEDAYYILTYAPKNPAEAGKIKVKVDNKKYKVLYDDNFRIDYIGEYFDKLEKEIKTPDLKIKDFSFKGKIFFFSVRDYMMKETKGKDGQAGHLKIRIRLMENESSTTLFDQQKMLTAQKNEMKISIPAFKKLKKGEYTFIIDAIDMLTGKEVNTSENVIVKR